MTLSTDVYVLDKVPPSEVLTECRWLLGATSVHPIQDREWSYGNDIPGERVLGHPIGLGLPALLSIHHRGGVPLYTAEQAAQHDEDCETDCDGNHYHRACWLDVDFDTAYGYVTPDGLNCGELHAKLVAALGFWLDSRGLRWEWRNEYTGDVHGGEDRYERLLDLCDGSRKALEWMQNTVMPAIMSGRLR